METHSVYYYERLLQEVKSASALLARKDRLKFIFCLINICEVYIDIFCDYEAIENTYI